MRNFLVLLFLSGRIFAADQEVVIDKAHTEIGFKIKHLMISSVRGSFKLFDGSARINGKTGKVSAIDIKIDANSIDTNEADRDKHLRSEDFFDTKKYPTVTFVSSGGELKQNKKTLLKGKLTIRNITKDVSLLVTYNGSSVDPWGNVHYGFEIEGKINRRDFGLNWNKTLDKGGVMISDEVDLVIEAQFLDKH